MATREARFGDVVLDLVSVQDHTLKAWHDYGQNVRGDTCIAGTEEIASFYEGYKDFGRALRCLDYLKGPSGRVTQPRRARLPVAPRARDARLLAGGGGVAADPTAPATFGGKGEIVSEQIDHGQEVPMQPVDQPVLRV